MRDRCISIGASALSYDALSCDGDAYLLLFDMSLRIPLQTAVANECRSHVGFGDGAVDGHHRLGGENAGQY